MGGIVNRNNILAIKPGTSVYPGGQDIYGTGADGKPKLLVREGELVVIDPATRKSLDETSIASVNVVEFAVGWGRSKYGRAKDLRKFAMEKINRCDLTDIAAQPHKCGTSAVTDIEFSCIKPDKVYSFYIAVEDYISESFSPQYQPLRRFYTVTTNECACEPDCSPVADCEATLKKFVDQINGIKTFSDDPGLYQSIRMEDQAELPFYAHVRYDYAQQFCLTPEGLNCDPCTHIPAITGITIDGDTTQFEDTTDPDDSTLTPRDQIQDVVDQINAALGYQTDEEIGVATVSGSTGSCCPLQIEINSSVAHESISLLGDGGTPITACGTEDFSEANGCAMRIVAKKVNLDCLCDPHLPDPKILNKTRKLHVDVSGGNWTCGTVSINQVQKASSPINLGYDWTEKDADSEVGGRGRGHDEFNTFRGKYMSPDKYSRVSNFSPFIKCDEGYCSISMEYLAKYEGSFQTHSRTVPVISHILIQQDDTENITAVQDIINAFIAPSSCPIFKTVQCIDSEGNIVDNAANVTGVGGYDGSKGFEFES